VKKDLLGKKVLIGNGATIEDIDPVRYISNYSSGKMGNEKSTVQNLVVVKVDVEKNLILVKGAIPGPKGGLVTIREAVKR